MEPNNRSEIWAFLKSEPVSAVLLAVVVLGLLMLGSVLFPQPAHGGEVCRVVKRKNVKAQTVLVPYNYGHKNVLLEIPADAVYSEVAYPIGVPVGTFAPVTYTPAPPGEGLVQPQLIQRVIETYEPGGDRLQATGDRDDVADCETCGGVHEGSCAKTAAVAPGSEGTHPHPGAAVAQTNCASCHTGAKAKAANRPSFWDDAGKFIASSTQQQKMLTSARLGTMPPKGPLSDDDYLALSSWLGKQPQTAEVQAPSLEERLARIEQLLTQPRGEVVGVTPSGGIIRKEQE